MNVQQEKKTYHDFFLKMRREMTVNGVNEVISFDEQDIHLVTVGGEMYIEGSDLHIDVLDVDKGIISLNGKIDAVYYSSDAKKEKKGFLGRLLR